MSLLNSYAYHSALLDRFVKNTARIQNACCPDPCIKNFQKYILGFQEYIQLYISSSHNVPSLLRNLSQQRFNLIEGCCINHHRYNEKMEKQSSSVKALPGGLDICIVSTVVSFLLAEVLGLFFFEI